MRRPGLCSKALIAALVAGLCAGPVAARPLLLPSEVAAATAGGARLGLVIIPLDAPSATHQGLLESVGEDAIRVAGRFELVPVADLFDPKAAATRAQNLEGARARMVEGQKHLDDLDTAKGTEAFADALKQLKETDTSQTFAELIKSWVMKAAGHALAGEAAPAKQEIERIIAVNPKAEFNPQFFPPELLKFVEAQRKLANLAKGELTVATEPPGANVWVDGQLRGRSPVTVNGLLGGRHQVVASLGGRALTLAELPPGSSSLELTASELAPNLKKAVDACIKTPKAKGRDQALMALGKTLGVEQVLAVLVKKSPTGDQFELTGLRLEVKDGHNHGYATGTQPLGEPTDALKGFFDSMLVTDTPRKGKDIVSHFDGDAGGGGSGKTIVGIALLGVAAGLVATGIGTGVVGQQRYEQFRATPQVQTGVSQGLANEARVLGGVSLGSFIGAGVATGVGIIMLATSGGSSSSTDDAKPTKKDVKKGASSKKEPTKKDEPKKDEPVKDEPKKDEPKKDEPKKDEPAKVDPKEEKRRKDEEAKKAKEEEARLKKEEEARAKAEAEEAKKKAEEDEKRRKEEEAAAKKSKKDDKKKADEEAKKTAEEEAAKKAEEEKKKKEDEARRAEEERKKKEAEKKKEEDHDDLRNY